jgi:hypothetical protein
MQENRFPKMPEQIQVFPDSGHHYTFVPFKDEILDEIPKLAKVCKQQRSPWFEMPHKKWVRLRYGMHEKKPGVWVCVESNIGSIKRGSLFSPKRQVPVTGGGNPEEQNVSPYAYGAVNRLPNDEQSKPISIIIPHPDRDGEEVKVAEFVVIWKVPNGDPIPVDLIVDFGNTRTVVLALEGGVAQDGKLAAVCHPIRFIKRGTEYKPGGSGSKADTSEIVDSWFVLCEPAFAELDPPSPKFQPTREYSGSQVTRRKFVGKKTERIAHSTERVPQMFIELSPVVMGDESRDILGAIDLDKGGNYSLSSPKRYTWDSNPVGQMGSAFWTMVLNRWNKKSRDETRLPALNGSMLRYFYDDGRKWDIENPPVENRSPEQRPVGNPVKPAYPRKTAMSWSALAILELAYRQITSEGWRRGNNPFIPRQLRSVFVTHPSGWIEEEARTYKDMWQTAIDIFSLTHFENSASIESGGGRPALSLELDEAVASQLPLVYSEIRRMGGIGENWIELYGKGQGDNARVRIMTIDIGGGTTDISIVEYWDELPGAGVALKYNPIFKDSNSYAGDRLVKEIIEQTLLPALASAKGIDSEHDRAEDFEKVFESALKLAADKAKWSRIVKLVFLPIIRQWLKDLTASRCGNPETGAPWAAGEIEGSEGALVDMSALADFNRFVAVAGVGDNFLDLNTPINYDPDSVATCINESLSPGLEPLAKYITAFEVDIVSLSGKPSELPQVKALLDDLLPILPQRIIPMINYAAGDWYPMSSTNRITDAKTVTAVGAALYNAIKNGQIESWSILRPDGEPEKVRNYWGLMPKEDDDTGFGADPYLTDKDDKAKVKLLVNSYIGRLRFLTRASRPEQQYKVVLKNANKAAKRTQMVSMLEVELLRDVDTETGQEIGLRLGSEVKALDGDVQLDRADLELQLCTLEGGEFWIDSGRFEIQWS